MLQQMLPAVDSLEESLDKLMVLMNHVREGKEGDIRILGEVCGSIEKRCHILERAFDGLEMRLR